jgi:hypothetical protein
MSKINPFSQSFDVATYNQFMGLPPPAAPKPNVSSILLANTTFCSGNRQTMNRLYPQKVLDNCQKYGIIVQFTVFANSIQFGIK